jgi:hypothetical protein
MLRDAIAATYRAGMWMLPPRLRVPLLHRRATGRWARIRHPVSFSDKLCRLKAIPVTDPAVRQLMVVTANKLSVREYVSERVSSELLTRDFHAAADPRNLPFERLPDAFVAKATHGSGWYYFVDRKSEAERAAVIAAGDRWLAADYDTYAGEWWYRLGPKAVVVEERLKGPDGGSPQDHKFFVFHGRVAMIQVDIDRFTDHKRNLYRLDWTQIDLRYTYAGAAPQPKPESLDKMIEIAEALGRPFAFVRVDLYAIGDRIVFGEMTHCPDTGWGFSDSTLDNWLGGLM